MHCRSVLLAMLCWATPVGAAAGQQTCQGQPTLDESPFVFVVGGSRVFDCRARLVWMRCIEGQQWNGETCLADGPQAVNPRPRMTCEQAKRFAAARSAGPKQWRPPTQGELLGLREPSFYNPSMSLRVVFPTQPAWSSDGSFWTSTPEGQGVAIVSAIGTSDAWSVTDADKVQHVRLVRTAPKDLK